MYSGHGRLSVCLSVCVCLCVCLSLATFPHYCTHPEVTLRNGRECPLVVHCWMDFQSVHGFRCYDTIMPNAKCHQVLVIALCLVSLMLLLIMVALCNRADHNIFMLFLLSSSSFFFFSSPTLSGRRLDVYHTLAHGVALVRI